MVNIEDVSYRYIGEAEAILQNLNLSVAEGECLLLCGKSGCGKTTITRLVNGLVPHFYEGDMQGIVLVNSSSIQGLKPDILALTVGSVFQNPRSQFFNTDTTGEIAFGCENMGLPSQEIKSRVQQSAKALGISHLLNRDIFSLSGGEKQLVSIASALALNPQVFVLDEPSSNLDSNATWQLATILKKLKAMGKTILIAEHRLYYLKNIADKVTYINNKGDCTNFTGHEFFALPDKKRFSMGLRTGNLANITPLANCTTIKETLPILQITRLSAAYNHKIPVLTDISFSASAGEIIGIVGKNGQGKSTLAKVLCGLHKMHSGEIRFHNKLLTAKKRIGLFYLVMQDTNYQLFTDSVNNELRLSKNKKCIPKEVFINHIMEDLSLNEFKNQHPMSLSGGQKQRCAIGVALAQKAEILIFDEPTSGLDYHNMQKVCKIVKDLSRQGVLVFIITHDYELLVQGCTRVLQIEEGKLAMDMPLTKPIGKKLYTLFNH